MPSQRLIATYQNIWLCTCEIIFEKQTPIRLIATTIVKIKCFFRVQQFIQGVSIEQYCSIISKMVTERNMTRLCYKNVGTTTLKPYT